VADGWRDKRRDGGMVIDVQSNEIVARGLSMCYCKGLVALCFLAA